MAKKSKERNETEFLRGELRKLKAQNKHLQKQLARAEKGSRRQESLYQELTTVTDPENYIKPEMEIVDNPETCPKCAKVLKVLDLGTRTLLSCGNGTCNYRTTKSKIIAKD